MAANPGVRRHTEAIVDLCQGGLAPQRLKTAVLARLRQVVPVDAAWWATCDPATLMFTQGFSDGLPQRTTPYFIGNEFLDDDVNKWTELAGDTSGVRSLAQATGGDLAASPRYRDVFAPMGLADELRVVLRVGGACWGLMCLHREAGLLFSSWEARYLERLAPHLAEGMRAGLLAAVQDSPASGPAAVPDAPGLVILDQSGDLVAATEQARAWFAEIGPGGRGAGALPVPAEVLAVAARLRGSAVSAFNPVGPASLVSPDEPLPRLTMRTAAGRWTVLHAAWLEPQAQSHDGLSPPDQRRRQIAVIIESAAAAELAPVIMHAYGLTPAERIVTGLVCQGLSTSQISARMHVSGYTVQDHLKSVFAKTGVRSRRELTVTILHQHYAGPAARGQAVGPTGFFA